MNFLMLRELMQNDTGENLEEEDSSYPFWYVGVMLYSFGAFCMAMGVVLQKYSINKELKKAHYLGNPMKSKLKQPFWILGIVLYGTSGGLLSAALGFAAQSQVTPLMSLVIISNAILARFMLSEPLTKRDFICVVVIVLAVVLTTVSAPTNQTDKDTDELVKLYKEPLFIGFIIGLLSLMLTLYLINRYVGKLKNEHEELTSRQEFLYSFSFGASAGCWGGLCVTMIKSALTIILDKFQEGNFFSVFLEPIVYVLAAILVTCWYQQLNWINKGLERYPAVFIVSIEAVVNEVVAVSGGLIYFQEYLEFDEVTGTIFALGMFLGVFGIMFFALRDNNVGPESDFFTNSSFFNCCKCCNLEIDYFSEPGGTKTRTVKSYMNNGSMIFLDENGDPTKLEASDNVNWEHIDSPLTVLAEGVKKTAKSVYESLTQAETTHTDERKKSVRRVSVVNLMKKAKLSKLRSKKSNQEIHFEDDASTVPSEGENEGKVKPSL